MATTAPLLGVESDSEEEDEDLGSEMLIGGNESVTATVGSLKIEEGEGPALTR